VDDYSRLLRNISGKAGSAPGAKKLLDAEVRSEPCTDAARD